MTYTFASKNQDVRILSGNGYCFVFRPFEPVIDARKLCEDLAKIGRLSGRAMRG